LGYRPEVSTVFNFLFKTCCQLTVIVPARLIQIFQMSIQGCPNYVNTLEHN
jgi:hypothetical protein